MNNISFNHISDQDLLKRYHADQNKEWLGILLQRYTLLLFGVSMKYLKNEEEAKDAVQQIFLKALKELEKYPVSYPKSWLYKIACNHCLMKLRDQRINLPLKGEYEYIAEESAGIDTYLQKEITLQMLEAGIAELNNEQKTCVTLFYLQKKSYQEITETTGYAIQQVKSNIQNGKRNLKIFMEKKQAS
ncbi:MAG: sigma-70 family RNA polymerase sigma factor [Sphingobacteriia bacterium]|nr:MAG: sigma-70 family RNA polymerase sigma factor [Sphingobacteriia bacterium]TAH07413.1 MAG: sigma-70 family RNA polymerase sigma factor [Sphingobacteriia bacterium]